MLLDLLLKNTEEKPIVWKETQLNIISFILQRMSIFEASNEDILFNPIFKYIHVKQYLYHFIQI